MASIHRVALSPHWHCFFVLSDGRRTHRSTGTSDKRKAWRCCLDFEKAAKLGREGRLTEARARETIADIFAVANQDTLPSTAVKDYLAGWLTKKRLELAERSYADYAKAAGEFLSHLKDKADKPMDALAPRDIVGFRSALAERVRGATVNKYLKILRGVWTAALKDGLARENIFARIGLVREARSDRRAFTLPELKRLLDVCDREWRGMVLFGIYTGQRLSDITSLTWREVDMETRELRLRTQKTGRNMTIPLATPLVKYLVEIGGADDPDAPLFPANRHTLRVNQATLSRQFGELLASVGLASKQTHAPRGVGRDSRRTRGELTFHCLRHTATSLLKNAGVSDVVAREIIGHDSEAVSRVYTHIETDTLRQAVNKMPNVATETRK